MNLPAALIRSRSVPLRFCPLVENRPLSGQIHFKTRPC